MMEEIHSEGIADTTAPPVTLSRREEALEGAGRAILGVIIVGALMMVILSFVTWVEIGPVSINGTDADALSDISDGYIVAALGLGIVACAAGILVRPGWTLALLPAIAVLALLALVVAGYTLATSWHASGTDGNAAFIYEGEPTAAPYVISGIAIAIAVLASVLAAFRASRTRAP